MTEPQWAYSFHCKSKSRWPAKPLSDPGHLLRVIDLDDRISLFYSVIYLSCQSLNIMAIKIITLLSTFIGMPVLMANSTR